MKKVKYKMDIKWIWLPDRDTPYKGWYCFDTQEYWITILAKSDIYKKNFTGPFRFSVSNSSGDTLHSSLFFPDFKTTKKAALNWLIEEYRNVIDTYQKILANLTSL